MFFLTVMLRNGIQTPHGEQPEHLGIMIYDMFKPAGAIVLKKCKVTTLYVVEKTENPENPTALMTGPRQG